MYENHSPNRPNENLFSVWIELQNGNRIGDVKWFDFSRFQRENVNRFFLAERKFSEIFADCKRTCRFILMVTDGDNKQKVKSKLY